MKGENHKWLKFGVIIAAIIAAWLLIPIVEFLSLKVVSPLTALLPYDNKFIAYLICTCILIACITSICLTVQKTKVWICNAKFSVLCSFCTLTIALLWIYERFLSHKWYFLSLYDTGITLVDILALTLFLIAVIIAGRRFSNSKYDDVDSVDKENNDEDSMLTDRPIRKRNEDKLNRSPFANNFIKRIMALETSNGACSLAITAPWGNGKTSFLNLVKDGLKKNDYRIIDVIPWNLNPEKSITAHFFEEIIKEIGGVDHQIAGFLKKYSDMLGSVDGGWFSNLSDKISLPALAQSISESMRKKGIKVVIVFDDIDRLGADEIEEVFRIIRGSANFTNFIFLSAFDKRYVQHTLQNSNPAFNEHYIEKFFEMEFALPELKKERIESIILDNTQWLNDNDKKEFEEYISHNTSWMGIEPPYIPLTNIRTIYRWLNSLKYRYSILKDECRIADLADLEMINLLFPEVYTLLARDYENFFDCESHQNTYKLWTESMKVSADSDWPRHLRQKHKRNLMKYCEEELKMNPSQIRTLSEILGRLVYEHRYQGESKGFSNPVYTQRYFDGILAQTDIPQSEFDAMLSGVKPYQKLIDEDKDEQYTHALYLLCKDARPKDINSLKRLLDLIFYASSSYSRFGVSYYIIRDIIYSFKLSPKDKHELFEPLLTKYRFSNFVFMSLIKSPHSDRTGWQEIFSESECDEILSDHFDKAINEGYSFEDISHLYYMAKVKVNNEDDEKSYKCKNERIKNSYMNILAKHSIENLSLLIYIKRPENTGYYLSDDFIDMWGTWDAYKSYLEEYHIADKVTTDSLLALNEFKQFFNEWDTKGREPILFDFQYIKIERLKKVCE